MRDSSERVQSLDAMLREERRRRRLGDNARCSQCGYPDLEALQPEGQAAICYDCARLRDGKSILELHHPIAKANGEETVPMPGNVHRFLSDQFINWPDVLQRNVWRDPLLTVAAVLRAITNFAAWITRHGLQLSDWLIQLRAWLVAQFGPRWWEGTGLPDLWAT